MEPRKIRGEDEARSCLAAVEASGRPRVEWAKAHGIDARSLHAWHVNLNRGRRMAARRRPAPSPPGPRLVELFATNPSVPIPYRVRCGVFEVEVSGDVDEDRLGRVLRGLLGEHGGEGAHAFDSPGRRPSSARQLLSSRARGRADRSARLQLSRRCMAGSFPGETPASLVGGNRGR